MIQKKMLLRILVPLLLFLLTTEVKAQQTNVDNAIALLKKSNTSKGLDTITFNKARQLLYKTVLTNAQISQIEKTAELFKKGSDEDLCYVIKITIIGSLTLSDKIKAIEYGRSTLKKLEKSTTPKLKFLRNAIFCELRFPYRNSNQLVEGFKFFTEKVKEYKKNKDSLSLANCYYVLGGFYRTIGLYESAMYNMKKSLSYLDTKDLKTYNYFDVTVIIGKDGWLNNFAILSDYYRLMGDHDKAIKHGKIVLKEARDYYKIIGEKDPTKQNLMFAARHIVLSKILSNQLDSVDYYLKTAERSVAKEDFASKAFLLQYRTLYNTKLGNTRVADSLLQKCWQLVNDNNINVNEAPGIIEPDYYLALLRIKQNRYNEAIALLLKNIERVKVVRSSVLRDYKLLAELYEKTADNEYAKEAYKSFLNLQESILADQKKFQTISFETEEEMNAKELSISKLENDNKISSLSRNFSIGIAILLLLIVAGIYNRFHSKKKANQVLEATLSDLKLTQSQLIQSEKMASLGELTAGIAHEIQNPLNFVNNFSEVSLELIDEMQEEMAKGETEEANAIAADIKQNLEKINYHGKRADGIVKGMLQHSRSGSSVKEPTDINKLADEYLRLAYHGLRAKDKSFNADLVTDFNTSLPKAKVLSQDIGRVLLNLFTNAFYATHQMQKQLGEGYKPIVSVTTSKKDKYIEISVKDNGIGIPDSIKDKILQPFFTTKPTGEGTGLGLSLSYDIIVKGHNGKIVIDSKEKEYTIFTIQIPIE